MTDPDDVYGIVANVVDGDSTLRRGARVWILQGDTVGGENSCRCLGLSKGGRGVEKWARTFRLEGFRAKWIPEHLRLRVWGRPKADAERQAASLDVMAQRERIARLRRQAARARQESAQ